MPAKGKGVDIDWDDEDEATMVFDKSVEDTARSLLRSAPPPPPPPPPAAGAPPPPPAPLPAAGTPPPGVRAAAALVSRPVSVPPPSRAPRPPPPKAMPSMPAPLPAPMASMPAPVPMPAPSYDRSSVAPSGGGKGMLFAIVVLLLCAGAAAVFLLMPKKGSIVVTVSGPGNKPVDAVQVYIDGKKACDVSPCRPAEQLAAGTHLIKVTAAGYQPTADQAVKIAAGDEAVQNISLTRASDGTGVRVTGEARGVKLSVDGKEVGPLPQELKDLTPGDHLLHVDGGDRYESIDKHINVESDQMQTFDPVLKVKKGLATIKLGDNADGAKVVLVSGSERRPLPQLPLTVDISVDKPYTISATKKGFADFEQRIEFPDGQAERTFVVNLSSSASSAKEDEGSSAKVSALPPVSGGGGGAKAAIGSAIGASPAPAPAPKAAAGGATLNINSIPVCNVLLDGRPMGQTPKIGVSVSPGSHTVVFISPEQGRKTKTVSVEAGKTATAVVRF